MAGQRPDQVESFRRAGFSVARPGGWDPLERMKDMVTDGVAAEVLYPSLGLGLFCLEDAALQEALFRTYNDWLIKYCQKCRTGSLASRLFPCSISITPLPK